MSERRNGSSARVRTDQEGHLSALADGSRPANSQVFAEAVRTISGQSGFDAPTHSPGDLRHLGLRPLEIGCLPTRSDQQEQRSTSVITGSRPGLFPSAHDGRSVLIAQSPVPAPTALDDDKFQHRSTKPRMTRIIPNRTSLLGTTLANVQMPDVGNGALSNERYAIQPVENETPAGRDRRGRLGKMVRGWGVAQVSRQGPTSNPNAIEQVPARRFCKQPWPRCMQGGSRAAISNYRAERLLRDERRVLVRNRNAALAR